MAIISEQHDTVTTVWVEGLMISPRHTELSCFRHTLLICPLKVVNIFLNKYKLFVTNNGLVVGQALKVNFQSSKYGQSTAIKLHASIQMCLSEPISFFNWETGLTYTCNFLQITWLDYNNKKRLYCCAGHWPTALNWNVKGICLKCR